jgi:hypothetical protein
MKVRRDPAWWKSAVVYQIYPRSFADSSDDGIGDLAGWDGAHLLRPRWRRPGPLKGGRRAAQCSSG